MVGRVGLADEDVRNPVALEARVQRQEGGLVGGLEGYGMDARGQRTGRGLACGVDDLGDQVAERQVAARDDVVVKRVGLGVPEAV